MAGLCRSFVLGRSLHSQLALRNTINYGITSRSVTLKVQKAKEEPQEDHDLRNIRIGRPQSPHLTIYAPQMTSMLSISHRMTGVALSSYMMALGIGAVALPNDINHYLSLIEGAQISPSLIVATKFLLAFPLCYHWCNGIRHLIWDTGKFLTNKGVYSTGYTMLGITALLTAMLIAL